MVVIPAWLDQIPQITFDNEKTLLSAIEQYAEADHWKVSDGSDLPLVLKQMTDVLLEDTKSDRRVRLAVLRKSSNNRGMIRVDASNLRTIELVYQGKEPIWRLEVAGIRVLDNFQMDKMGWKTLVKLLFQQ